MTREIDLIRQYQQDFTAKTGGYIKVSTCSKLEADFHVSDNINKFTVASIIMEHTGWKWELAIGYSGGTGKRGGDQVLFRQMLCAICKSGGMQITSIARFISKDHTSILNLLKRHRDSMDTDMEYRLMFNELIRSVQENYHAQESMTEEQFLQQNKQREDDFI